MDLPKLHQRKRRVGRGISAGQGKTAGRGTKGQNARSGHKRSIGFGSGALSLAQRLPKMDGNRSSKLQFTITTSQISQYFKSGEKITRTELIKHKLLPISLQSRDTVKIVLGQTKIDSLIVDKDIKTSKSLKK